VECVAIAAHESHAGFSAVLLYPAAKPYFAYGIFEIERGEEAAFVIEQLISPITHDPNPIVLPYNDL
jgi:hypothetical protein